MEKMRCSGEGEHNEEFGSLLSSAIPVDFDSRQGVRSEACALRSFSRIQALSNDDELRSRMGFRDIIAENLSKAGWRITRADNFGLWPQSERAPDVLLCGQMKN
jgi:hypothetical protein